MSEITTEINIAPKTDVYAVFSGIAFSSSNSRSACAFSSV